MSTVIARKNLPKQTTEENRDFEILNKRKNSKRISEKDFHQNLKQKFGI